MHLCPNYLRLFYPKIITKRCLIMHWKRKFIHIEVHFIERETYYMLDKLQTQSLFLQNSGQVFVKQKQISPIKQLQKVKAIKKAAKN